MVINGGNSSGGTEQDFHRILHSGVFYEKSCERFLHPLKLFLLLLFKL